MSERPPATYYVTDIEGKSLPFPLQSSDGIIEQKVCKIIGRKRSQMKEYTSPLGIYGFPGVPYEEGTPNPTVYMQGEDVIFDMFLYFEGKPVITKDFNISAVLKLSTRASGTIWTGKVENGIYPKDTPGHYLLWIPKEVSSTLFAGSYYLDIVIVEPIGTGEGPKDRTVFLASTIFQIEYSAASPNPEGAGNPCPTLRRSNLENTWPNTPDTIGSGVGPRPISPPVDEEKLIEELAEDGGTVTISPDGTYLTITITPPQQHED